MSEDTFDSEEAIAEFKALMRDPAARQAFVEIKATKEREGVRMRYEHVMKAVFGSPWAIREEYLAVIVDIVLFRAAGGRLEAEEIEQRIGARRRTPSPAGPAGVAVVPLHGVIIPKAGGLAEISGGTSIERFRASFREAMASPDTSSVVLDIDSPGGMVDQVPEMAAEIRAARGSKPIVAMANTEAASAAYWLGSQADEFVVTKSARVGSIGVLTAHEDQSKQEEIKGLKTTLISAGKFKTEGNPFAPLSDEARSHLQAMVNDYYGMFVSDVARGRGVSVGTVREGFGQGRVLGVREALAEGMVDRMASLEEVVGGLLSAQRPTATGVVHLYGGLRMNPETEEFAAAVDNSAWDGNRAMGECETASDYRSICAGEHSVGDPGERQHWALPHHYLSKVPSPNAAGVRNALARLPQTQDLTNRQRAQSHLDAHMREINPEALSEDTPTSGTDEILRFEAQLEALSE